MQPWLGVPFILGERPGPLSGSRSSLSIAAPIDKQLRQPAKPDFAIWQHDRRYSASVKSYTRT
jgi:hypothetical protein